MTRWKHVCNSAFHRARTAALVLLVSSFCLPPSAFSAPRLSDLRNPTAVWWQPARNVPMLAAQGVNVFFGPEVENSAALSPAALAAGQASWVKAVADAGAYCVLKQPSAPVPANCVGFILTVDEPNAKLIPAAALKGNFDALRALDPSRPIFLSMAGGTVTSANLARPAELQLLKDYAGVCDVFTVDCYPCNGNATRYPMTWTGDAAQKLAGATGRPVWAWIECNDQQKPAPTSKTDGVHLDINRGPTAAEIRSQVDYAVAQGATGIGWFATCDSGKYGWPGSYWPLVDRNHASLSAQLAMVASIGLERAGVVSAPGPPTTSPATQPADGVAVMDALAARVAALEAWRASVAAGAATQPSK